MIKGQKVVCVDDSVSAIVRSLYTQWIKKGTTYVIREVILGSKFNPKTNSHSEGEICLLLVGIENPCSPPPHSAPRGFNSERFRPIEDLSLIQSLEQLETADADA